MVAASRRRESRDLAEQSFAGERGLLKAHGHRDRGSCCERLAGSGVACEHLASVDSRPDPDREPVIAYEIAVQPGEGFGEFGQARTARSASSSCTCGTPKTVIAVSPANFSSVPP